MRAQVYVAEPGYMLSRVSVPKQAILTHLAGALLPDLDTFAQVRARTLAHPRACRHGASCTPSMAPLHCK